MINLTYNLSSNIKTSLGKIEGLRLKILSIPISTEAEIRLKWDCQVKRIYWSLLLHENPLTRTQITELISRNYTRKKHFKKEEQEVLGYKKALDFIKQNWLVSSRNISPKAIISLHDIACKGSFRATESSLKQVLDYLQASSEHPVIQAAILQIALLGLDGFSNGNGRTSRLSSYLVLYKFGYDFRGLLYLDEYFKRDPVGYKETIENFINGNNLTIWLEYFCKALEIQLDKTYADILTEKYSTDLKRSFFELNDRQKEILLLLDQPNATITNKKVQKMFKVSQITASRDLSKLTTLGILFDHGKGRSVYYAKV